MMSNNAELRKVFAAGNELAELINTATADEIEELSDYVNDGFPICFDVEFDADGEVENIEVAIGHCERMEWHGTGDTLDNLRAFPKSKLLNKLTDHIEIAIGNHRDQLEAA